MGEDLLVKIIKGLIDNGKLMIIGLGGHGKTSATMHLIREIMKTKEYQEGRFILRLSDTVNVWKWKYDTVPYVDMTKTRTIPEDEQTLLLDLGFSDPDRNTAEIENLVRGDYIKQRDMITALQGELRIRRIYMIEEIQNVLGSYSLSGKSGKFWLKEISEGRNYGQYVIGLGQRLADISAKVVERTRYFLLGAISGENDANKIKRMVGSERGQRVVDALLGLKRGEFLWLDKDNPENSMKIYFPEFKQNGKPFEYILKTNGHIIASRVFI